MGWEGRPTEVLHREGIKIEREYLHGATAEVLRGVSSTQRVEPNGHVGTERYSTLHRQHRREEHFFDLIN